MKTSRTLAALGLAVLPALALAHSDWPVPEAEKARTSPIKADEAARGAGAKIYADKCANCHGPAGQGDGKASSFLKVKPSILTDKMVAEQSDGELFFRITTGRRPMPAFGEKLTETERWQVIAFVRTLKAPPTENR